MSFTVFNISKRLLNEEEINLLSKGLNFSPNRHFDLFHTILDVNRFSRLLTLKKHFGGSREEDVPGNLGESGESPPSPISFNEVCALQDLITLADDSDPPPMDPTDLQ